MLKNYFKTGIRSLWRNKGYSFITIFGLAVAIACCVLIMSFVKSELSYDKFHTKHERIYRVWQHEKYEGEDFIGSATPLMLGATLKETYPEVESSCRVFAFDPQVSINNQAFNEKVRMIDTSFFRIFDFNLVQGDRGKPFPIANSVILTTETAKKYFGNANSVGKTILITLGKDQVPYTVAGLVEKSPEESSIKFNMLISYANSRYLFSENAHHSWYNVFSETYVLLRSGVSGENLEKKLPAMMKEQLGTSYKEGAFVLHLQPIAGIHLDTSVPVANEPISDPKYAYLLSTIGLLILLVACINFITLSIGHSAKRALEVGIRKTLGAARKQVIHQFWSESFILTLFSVVLGIVFAFGSLNAFNALIDRRLSMNFDLVFLLFILSLIAVIGLVAGIYPAVILSGYKPIEVLKGKLKMRTGSGWLRQGLIVGQFTASIVLVTGTIIIVKQMNFLKNKNLGYDKEQVIVVPTNKGIREGGQLAKIYSDELVKEPGIAGVSTSLYSFAETPWVSLGITDDKKVYHDFKYNAIDARFIDQMNIALKAGRNFSESDPSDEWGAAIVNEAFLKEFGITDPIGKKLPGKMEEIIIGVVKDFNYESLHSRIEPLLLTMHIDSVARRIENISYTVDVRPRISVKVNPGNAAGSIDLLRAAWKKTAPGQEFEYRFLDDAVNSRYKTEERTGLIIRIASGLSLFIACLGLFGLATLTVNRRTKEIGIRKVLGAGLVSINTLLAKDFIRLILVAVVIASPVAWLAMSKWLEDFAYHTDIPAWSFIAAGTLVLLIAMFTISIQTSRAATANPVKSLRTE